MSNEETAKVETNEALEQQEEKATPKTTVSAKSPLLKGGKYVYAIGRRKSATAQVRVYLSSKREVEVNGKDYKEYFSTEQEIKTVLDPLVKTKSPDNFRLTVLVKGGGKMAQAEAIRHGFSRALSLIDEEFYKTSLKKLGFLKRDPRAKERKKFGLRGARRSPQWSKR